jgi:hypothetical protein
MSMDNVVGVRPWLPWPLSGSAWWTEPVRAERLAALRIGLATVVLLDICTTYLPHLQDFFGAGSLGSPEVFSWVGKAPSWSWSLLRGVEDGRILLGAMILWCIATFCLLVGFWTRVSAVAAWVLATSFLNLNPYLGNAGDQIAGILLFYLVLCPCGAVWSVDHWLARSRRAAPRLGAKLPSGDDAGTADPEPVFVPPWPLRLLFIQMTLIYFCNGLYKVAGADWREGDSLYYVLADLTLARWSYAQVPIPYWVTRLLSWTVMVWEVSFPLLMALPWIGRKLCQLCRPAPDSCRSLDRLLSWVRVLALCFGVAFHIGIGVSLELGWFAAYMLCFYLPLLPWENSRWATGREPQEKAAPRHSGEVKPSIPR